jgi:hypothetical protein
VGDNGWGTRTFWTTAIDDSDVTVQFAAGKAEMRVDNLSVPDYLTRPIALGSQWQTAFNPGVVSFDVVWSTPITRRLNVPNGTLGNNYAGEYVENQASVTWSGTNLATGFTFTSNPGTLATSSFDGGFVELGHEGNGIFGPASTDSAAVARSLVSTTASPASTGTPLAPPLQLAVGHAATPTSSSPAIQLAPGLVLPPAGAAHPLAIDQLFADLSGALSETI